MPGINFLQKMSFTMPAIAHPTIDLIRNTEGLVRVVQYLDTSRGLV